MKNIFSLAGKSILVTGASSGIGRQIAITTSEFGADVTLVGRNQPRLDETRIAMTAGNHEIIEADLTRKEDLKTILDGKVFDGVVFNAGIVEYAPVKFLSEEKIKKIFDTNFNSAALLCQQLLKNRKIQKQGSLIFVSSISSKLGVPGTALYASSKAALSAFTKVVASEVASQGIRSNSICPGIIRTPMTELAKAVTSGADVEDASKAYPLGYGNTTDISGLVVFLLSDASRWMTGSDIILDGGLTLN
ncbi:3-oxoacyl-ACP reductase [Cytophagales bacterium WSM2-2]|nr:3-oxoacyl-ACP reductase [Cytophagales bacterium WSM2-2]